MPSRTFQPVKAVKEPRLAGCRGAVMEEAGTADSSRGLSKGSQSALCAPSSSISNSWAKSMRRASQAKGTRIAKDSQLEISTWPVSRITSCLKLMVHTGARSSCGRGQGPRGRVGEVVERYQVGGSERPSAPAHSVCALSLPFCGGLSVGEKADKTGFRKMVS